MMFNMLVVQKSGPSVLPRPPFDILTVHTNRLLVEPGLDWKIGRLRVSDSSINEKKGDHWLLWMVLFFYFPGFTMV